MKATVRAVALSALAATASAQVPAGGPFEPSDVAYDQTYARVAMEPDGDFIVVWDSWAQDGNQEGVFGQRFAASGTKRGGEFRINTYTPGAQQHSTVAVGPKGDFFVVWQSRDNQDGLGSGIFGRRFDAAGNPLGGEIPINNQTLGNQGGPHVVRSPDGGSIVSWSTPDANAMGTAARRFDSAGNPIGGEFIVNTFTTGSQYPGDVAVDANGNFVVVWEDRFDARDGWGYGIFGQRYDAAANPLGSEFLLNTYSMGQQEDPSIAMTPGGDFVVTWESQFGDGSWGAQLARRFDAAGNGIGSDFVVSSYTTGNQFNYMDAIAVDALGNFIVTWQGEGAGDVKGIFAQRFDASGARRGAEVWVNAPDYWPDQKRPSVASDEVGNFVIVWESDVLNDTIYGQRFGGLRPRALTVDPTGNAVLEAGETVDVRPTWGNDNGAAQTFSGTLTRIAGPAGATYAIADGAGDYGTVPDGTDRLCTDCYQVSVSSPPTRPAVHWDVSAVESILPDVQGQQKQWMLHVGESFSDVARTNPFYRFIETLLHHGVTGGCGAGKYCPDASTTREQMAVFALVAKEGVGYVPPACTAPAFADVPASSPFCRWIKELARRGVVSGCGGGNYCPAATVTREQMSVFVLRTLDLAFTPPACTTPLYNDVPANNPFCPWIEELTRRGVVSGCGGGSYCPTQPVTREQMGVFISVTFRLTLYGP